MLFNNNPHNMGIGDWGLGIGDWGLGPIPNPQFYFYDIYLIHKIK